MSSALFAVALLPLAAALLVVGFRAPMHILLPAYAALVPFGSGFAVPGVPDRFGSPSSLVGLLLTAALVRRVCSVGISVGRLPSDLPAWLFLLALAALTGLWSIAPDASFAGLLVIASLIILYALVSLAPVDRRAVTRTEIALIVGGSVASFYGIVQAFTGSLPTSEMGGPRFGRDLLGANHTAAALLLPLAIALTRTAVGSPRGRIASAVAVLLLVSGVALSGSRGALLGAVVTFLVVAMHGRRRKVVLGYGLLVTAAVVVLFALAPGGVGERQTSADSSGRLDIWRVGLAGCERYCAYGSGWATFPDVYEQTLPSVPEAEVLVQGTSYEPHNIWLLAAVEAGIAGLVVLSLGLALSVREAWRLPRGVRGPPLAALAGTLTTATFLSNFEFKYFWMVLIYVTLKHHSEGAVFDERRRRLVGARGLAGNRPGIP